MAKHLVLRCDDLDKVSHETVRNRLKEKKFKPWLHKMWCLRKIDADFIAQMEDILDLYAEAADPRFPVAGLHGRPPTLARGRRLGDTNSSRLRPGHEEAVRRGLSLELVETLPRGFGKDASQLRSSSGSVIRLIAEGADRDARGDKRRRFEEANGEVRETVACLDDLADLGALDRAKVEAAIALYGRVPEPIRPGRSGGAVRSAEPSPTSAS